MVKKYLPECPPLYDVPFEGRNIDLGKIDHFLIGSLCRHLESSPDLGTHAEDRLRNHGSSVSQTGVVLAEGYDVVRNSHYLSFETADLLLMLLVEGAIQLRAWFHGLNSIRYIMHLCFSEHQAPVSSCCVSSCCWRRSTIAKWSCLNPPSNSFNLCCSLLAANQPTAENASFISRYSTLSPNLLIEA